MGVLLHLVLALYQLRGYYEYFCRKNAEEQKHFDSERTEIFELPATSNVYMLKS